MKNMLCFLLGNFAAYAIFMVSPTLALYALQNWGIRAFRLAISLESYAVMLIGYFSFKSIFDGKK